MDDHELTEVAELEVLLLQPEIRNDSARLLDHLHADFVEYGASGRIWDRESIAHATAGATSVVASRLRAQRLGPDAVLVTYRSEADGRRALRSSTWVRPGRGPGRWRLLFHQGTPLID